ncbi:hypothetical protein FIL70_24675 (plasmid) [Sphingobium fuliginis ATCC 27551]|uniref:Uncharacterized protein n=1 Tax=Sphingobium fuliginis ATCC 27551 TaxID=1208342 RepID=A0A5B8CNV0_SPHSA|nr:hypothetical protein FIL70_24675 [Sphingobium fuliginis ATCC 27551]
MIDPGQAPTTIRRPTVWANFQMKPLGRFTPEPPPPRAEIWKVSIALALLVLGIGIALFSFYDAGAISDDVFVAVVVFVIAVCIGVILSLDWEQTAHRRVRQPWQEVPLRLTSLRCGHLKTDSRRVKMPLIFRKPAAANRLPRHGQSCREG